MKVQIQRLVIPGLAVLCGLAALALIPALHLPRSGSDKKQDSARPVQAIGLEAFNEISPTMQEVVAKHLFIPERKATGQNSFPDLVVKGVFLGDERSVVFSLKSKPQANLRVWAGGVQGALSQITDPRDPRQPIAQFLRDWTIKEISFSGVTVAHFITGEVEIYAVDYTPDKKVKDDASRGYGQGIIPQGDGGQAGGAARTASASKTSGQTTASGQPVNLMADRVSAMLQRMSPDQKKQFLQRVQQGVSGAAPNKTTDSKQSTSKNTPESTKNSKTGSSSTQKKKTK